MRMLRTLRTALSTSAVAAALLVGVSGAASAQDAACGAAPGTAAVVTDGAAPAVGPACAPADGVGATDPAGAGAAAGTAQGGAAEGRGGPAGAQDGAWPDSRGAAVLLAVALVAGALAVARLVPAGPAERVRRPRAGSGEGWRRASAPGSPNGATTGPVRPGPLTPTWR